MMLMVACPYSSAAGEGQWQNSLKPKGEPAHEIALAVGGQTEYVIVIPSYSTRSFQERKAAEDLQQWLGEMTGAEFAIVSDTHPARDTEISVGRTRRLAVANLAVAQQDLGDEGYAIAVKGSRLFLIGGKNRGPIYAALAFMEEDLGLRWYSAEVSRVLRQPTFRVKVVPRSYVPPLAVRDPFFDFTSDGTWSLRNRTNSRCARNPVPEEWGGRINYATMGREDWSFCHTLHALVPPQEYFEEHPEYYSNKSDERTPRQLCLTNPAVVKIATENALRILRESPNAELISISQMDYGHYCECPECRALDQAEGTHAAQVLHFVNQVAAGIEKEYPDVLVSTLAYFWSMKAPKTLRPRKNVVIRVCTNCAMWPRPFVGVRNDEGPVPEYCRAMGEDPTKSSFKKFFLGWRDITDQITIWDYWTNFAHRLAPMPNIDVIADNIRFFTENDVKGVFAQNQQIERQCLRSWVAAKLLWDPSRDTRELIQDFIWGYYGKAAPAMAEYNALLWQMAHEEPSPLAPIEGNYPMDSEFLSPEFLDKSTAIFDRAEKLAETEEILHRVERDRLSVMYVKLMRGPAFVTKRAESYPAMIDRFEVIARQEEIDGMGHHKRLDEMLQGWRDGWRVYNESKGGKL